MFTKKPKSFCITITTETEFSDWHKMTAAFLRSFVKRITSKNVAYRDHKHFNQNEFLHKIDLEINNGKSYSSYKRSDDFSDLFKRIIDKHTPVKQKKVRGNNAQFMTKKIKKSYHQ